VAQPVAPVPVTFVSSHAYSGGSERYLELLLGELGEDWVNGVVALADGPFVERMRGLGWRVEVVPTPARLGMLPAALRLRRVLLARRPAVVHANGVKAALVAGIATAGSGIPVLWLKHDFSWDGPLARLVAWRSAAVVAVAGAITTVFGARLARKVSVVPNGIPDLLRDRGPGRARLEVELGAATGAPLAVLVGRLDRAKGQLELVEAVPRVLEAHPEARFGLIGGESHAEREYAQVVWRRIEELGVGESVTWLGHRDDALDLVAGADLLVVSSVPDARGAGREACPYALLEAMSLGTAVVAYADGGIPEVLGEAGRLVPPGNREALGAAIAELLGDRESRGALADAARERVLQRNRVDAMAGAMMARYAELASG
jgi:glycosyltransferase involved in cell wall biosynthesis